MVVVWGWLAGCDKEKLRAAHEGWRALESARPKNPKVSRDVGILGHLGPYLAAFSSQKCGWCDVMDFARDGTDAWKS